MVVRRGVATLSLTVLGVVLLLSFLGGIFYSLLGSNPSPSLAFRFWAAVGSWVAAVVVGRITHRYGKTHGMTTDIADFGMGLSALILLLLTVFFIWGWLTN